ncbi:hypothetical protein PEL8287_01588 [Roseovarius litorisediminis]|uniref:Excalibur calcium-binding domain-containing protein n=1 Tax=Roseovarius litorisediminis TaxID=1312363 RepID=A0A1Y5S5C2_9RHOB|nr:hypothetical protein [Roseovarius litorisediminis]SLN32869.1 hypothetical protein PEL8287_01588 [Roseovarius litorisediminis]
MRFVPYVLALVALAACVPPIPDSGAGVGFNDYDAYLQEKQAREAQLAGSALPRADAVSSETVDDIGVVTGRSPASSDIAADTRAALDETAANSGQPVVHASPSNPAPAAVTNASGISKENDFEAVGAQRSIESDKAKIAQDRAQYQVIQPQALPTRSGSGGPNIVDYALRSKHPRGTRVYSRSGFNSNGKYQRNCAKYASPDRAQSDFLSRGGPDRDKLGLDPDGDGYACAWDPSPFRRAVGG